MEPVQFAPLPSLSVKDRKVIILDFDGVLCVPHSHPELPYPHIDHLLSHLEAEKFVLCVASYNPLSRLALRRWGWLDRFQAARCGSNWHWEHHEEYTDETHRADLCKSRQIVDILEKELADLGLRSDHCAFFDDTPANLQAVQSKLPGVACVLVPSDKGLQWSHIVEAHH